MSIRNQVDLLVEEATQVADGQGVLLDRDDLLNLISRLAEALRHSDSTPLAVPADQGFMSIQAFQSC